MSYDVEYDEITNFGFTLNSVTGQTIEGLSSIMSSLDNMINLDSFKGQTAECMKSYMNEVSKTLVASAITVLSELNTQFLLYKDGYSAIDDNLHFRINEEKLADLKQFYRSSWGDFDSVHIDAQRAINSVSDLVAVTQPDPTSVSESYDETGTSIIRLRDNVGDYEAEHSANDFTMLNELLSPLNALISEFAGKSKAPYQYTSMDIVNSSNFAALGNALQASVEKNDALADQINAANDRENQRYEALVAEWAQAREEQGWLETVTGFLEVVGGVLTIVGSAVSIVATAGASTPLAVVGITAGIGMIVHGGSNMAEGIQDIYYGSTGDPFTVAINPVKDTIFSALFGEENRDKAWDIFGATCAIVGTVATLGATGMAAAASASARMAATGVCTEVVKAAGRKAAVEFAVKAGITMLAGAGSGFVGKEVARMAGASDTVAETIGIVTAVAGAVATGYGMSRWQWSYEPGSMGIPDGVCFVAGTPIVTALGSAAIETIVVGDIVVSTDPATGETSEKEVTETYVRESKFLVHLLIDGQELSVTPNHPFYVSGRSWVKAVDLTVGDPLRTPSGELVPVQRVHYETLEQAVTVYNLEIKDYHTYYAGIVSVLVHNADYKPRQPVTGVTNTQVNEDGSTTYTKIIDGEEVSVTYSEDGYPDFSPYAHPDYPDPVEIEYSGNRRTDAFRANSEIGLTGNEAPNGYTWHHMEDGKSMRLVERTVHDSTIGGFPHTGGVSVGKN